MYFKPFHMYSRFFKTLVFCFMSNNVTRMNNEKGLNQKNMQ